MVNRRIFLSLVLMLLPFFSVAHLNSVSFSTIEFNEKEISVALRYTLLCIEELFQADRDRDRNLSPEELQDLQPLLHYYLNNKIKVLSGGRQLRLEIRKLQFSLDDDEPLVLADLSFLSKEKIESAIIFCNLSEESDPYHRNLSQIKIGENQYLFVFTHDNYFNSAHPPHPIPKTDPESPPSVMDGSVPKK